jgi:hypothetical protein
MMGQSSSKMLISPVWETSLLFVALPGGFYHKKGPLTAHKKTN